LIGKLLLLRLERGGVERGVTVLRGWLHRDGWAEMLPRRRELVVWGAGLRVVGLECL
jgi:hypothetical protein